MKAVLDRLPILVLEPHNRCNCRCVMCDIWKTTDVREITVADLDRHAADIVAFARLHQAHDQGLPVWRERPAHIRQNTVARVPPMQMIKEQR